MCSSRRILFAKYLPEKFRSRVEIQGPNQSYRRVDGEKISDADRLRDATKQEDFGFTFAASKKWRETFADALAAKFDTASNVRDMDKEGVDIGVLFPTVGLYIMWRDNLDPELSAAICRAYNTWMSDYCSARQQAPQRRSLDTATRPHPRRGRIEARQRSSAWSASSGGLINSAAAPYRAPITIRSMDRRRPRHDRLRARRRAHRAGASRLGPLQRVRPPCRLSSAWNRCSPA